MIDSTDYHPPLRHEGSKKLHGIVYLQKITDNRVGDASSRSIRVFQNLCGEDALGNAVLCTTMWEDLKDETMGIKREAELKEKETLWKRMCDKGSRVDRHYGTQQSASRIVSRMLDNTPKVLQIQTEMVDEKKALCDSGAGIFVAKDIITAREKVKAELDICEKAQERAIAKGDRAGERHARDDQEEAKGFLKEANEALRTLMVNHGGALGRLAVQRGGYWAPLATAGGAVVVSVIRYSTSYCNC